MKCGSLLSSTVLVCRPHFLFGETIRVIGTIFLCLPISKEKVQSGFDESRSFEIRIHAGIGRFGLVDFSTDLHSWFDRSYAASTDFRKTTTTPTHHLGTSVQILPEDKTYQDAKMKTRFIV